VTPVDSGGYIINSIVVPHEGGGSGSSEEHFYRIVCEKTSMQNVSNDSIVSYNFVLDCNIVKYINFTSHVSAGEVVSKVEILKNTSALVNVTPPNIVFKNLNIWVGNNGWATEKNMSDATVTFVVEKSWVHKNNIDVSTIFLYRYVNDTWYKLETQKVGEDSHYLYFEAKTPGFSPFAISGEKVGPEFMPFPFTTTTGTGVLPTINESTLPIDEKKPCWWCLLILIIICLIIYSYLRKASLMEWIEERRQ